MDDTRLRAEVGVREILRHLGEDVCRSGLKDTPARMVRAYEEMLSGYKVDIPSLFRTFDETFDELVMVKDISFVSVCEHHMLPFVGKAHVGYLPSSGRVIGLSKLARLVDAFARRLQVQERLTQQIALCVWDNLKPLGVGCVIEAEHACMSCRGVRKDGAKMVTSYLTGVLRTQPDARAEFLALVR